MLAPLLLTKLYVPPPRANIVLRPRLIECLNAGLQNKLTLISAPAGFGKTTLVSEWLAGCQRPAAWVSLDEGDNDLSRFLTYFIAALQTVNSKIGKDLLSVINNPHQPPSTESVLTELINQITTIPENFILILDDYHMIDSKPVDEALSFLLEHLPVQMHLVITTREDPQLPLNRLRARGQLIELRAADLRFSTEEVTDFLNQVMGLNLSVEDINALEIRTEGWVAGLQLAAISIKGNSDVSEFIREFAGDHRYIVDYLIEEVLRSQPEPIRRFLLKTSILDRMNGSLCDAVTGTEESHVRLEVLQRGNFFIIPLDDRRNWYRYHRLFADFLHMHLVAEYPDQVAELHRRASAWCEHNGSMDNAIRHALAAGDFSRAADLVELVFPGKNLSRQFTTLLGWLKSIPDEIIRFRPVLSTEYALVSMSCGENESVEPRLRDAERWLEPTADISGMVVIDHEEFRRVPGMIAIIRAGQALGRGDMPGTVKNAHRVLELAPENDYLMLGGAASQLGLVAWTNGDLDTARRMTADGIENLLKAGYISPAIGGTIVLADIQIAQGCLHEAMNTYERGLRWVLEPETSVRPGAADMYVGMSSLFYEHNDLKTAIQLLHSSQALGELAGLPQNPYRWRAAMARILEARGDLDGALDLLDQAERVFDSAFSPNVRPIAVRKTRVWVAQGSLGEALGWVSKQGLSVENELNYLREFEHITLARVLLACYQSDHTRVSISGLMEFLERLLKAAEKGGRMGSVIEILILHAIANQARGNLPDALLSLQKALVLAEPEGYSRIFLDEGTDMKQLLRETVERGIMPGYTSRLLAEFEFEKTKNVEKQDFSLGQSLIDPLSQRELEVLKLLRSNLSGPEIALQLSVSINTFRTHTKNIFIKLGVNDRRAAIQRAEELNLI